MIHPDGQPSPDHGIVDRFSTDGFAVIHGLFDATEIAEVRGTLDRLFSADFRLPRGHAYDLDHRPSGEPSGNIPAIRNALQLEPSLHSTHGIASAVTWAGRLMGTGAEVLWDAAIYKPPGGSSETPWHQDEAEYRLAGIRRPDWLVYFWIALDDVDADCGAIRFVLGSHKGPLRPHAWRNGIPDSSLVVVGPTEDQEVATIPLGAGDATVHHPRTLHGSGINLTDRCRKAWILGVGRPRAPRWIRRLKHHVLGLSRRP